MSERTINLVGYVMWLAGSAMFAFVSWRNDDLVSLIASLFFFFGVLAVMIPIMRR